MYASARVTEKWPFNVDTTRASSQFVTVLAFARGLDGVGQRLQSRES